MVLGLLFLDIYHTISDFKDENELKTYLHEMYEKTVQKETGSLYSSIQPLVTIALHYMRESGKDNPQV